MAGDTNSTTVTTWSAAALPAKPTQTISASRYDPYNAEYSHSAPGFDIGHFLRIAAKHRWLIVGSVLVALILGTALSLMLTPLYTASVTIETAADTVQVTSDQSLQPKSLQDPSNTATYVELLNSRSLAERVVDELRLTDDSSFVSRAPRPSFLQRIRHFVTSEPSTEEDASDLATKKRSAIDRILKNTSARVIKTSRLLMVSYTDPDPVRAQRIANALASGFISANIDRRFDATSYARRFLENQLQQIRLRLEESERKVVTYADKEQLVNLDNKQSLLSAQLENLNTALATATIARSNAEELWRRTSAATNYSDIPAAALVGDNGGGSAATSVLNQLRASRSQLLADYQEKLLTFKPGFPLMVSLKARMDDTDRQIADEIEKIKIGVRSSYELAAQREQGLLAAIDVTKKQLIDARNRGVQYTMLQREADTNRTLYDGLLQRFKEISVVGGLASNELSIVDQAELPTAPTSPKKGLNIAIAGLLGLMIGLSAAFIIEHIDNTIKAPDQMESLFGLPVLGVIPVLQKNETMRSVLDDPQSPLAEAYRSTRTALQFSTERGAPKTMVVTSARPSEGKTTSAAALARMFGQLNLRVLLIDADLRNPSLHKVFETQNVAGLSNYLAGGAAPTALIQSGVITNVDIMTAGPMPPNPAELLSGPRMLAILAELSSTFDIIIVDSPPIMGLADALLLSSVAEATLVVCASGETPVNVVKGALRRMSSVNSQLIGFLMTKFDAKRAGYGYSYYGYDYYGYGDARSLRVEGHEPPKIAST